MRKKVPYSKEPQIKSLVLRKLVNEGLDHLVRQRGSQKIEIKEVELSEPKAAKSKRKSENEKRWELPRLWKLRR